MRRPTFCSSLDDDPTTPATSSASCQDKDKESRLMKVKRMIADSILLGRRKKESGVQKENNNEDDAAAAAGVVSVRLRKESALGETVKLLDIDVPASATTEIVLKPRKRKERLDSGGSTNQETKVIRSSSEERATVKSDSNVRRVWSHGELKVLAEVNISNNVDAPAAVTSKDDSLSHNIGGACATEAMRERKLGCDDLEARRSSERFSRTSCGAPRRRKVSRRAPPPDRAPSPAAKLDVASLHRQVEGGEPIASRPNVLSPDDEAESPAVEALISPRNSLVMRLAYLDPNLPPSPPQTHLHALRQHDKQERRLIKQISSIKKQLKRYEEGFQIEFGYKPSQADKMANKDIRRLLSEMNRLKQQQKQMKEDFESASVSNNVQDNDEKLEQVVSPTKLVKFAKCIEDALQDVNKRLDEKRVSSGRGAEMSEMTSEQLQDEKLAVQKALLTLENSFGRPVVQRDRDIVRPLYQRYRALKRMVARSNTGKLNNSANELATILEHEAMEFSPSASVDGVDERLLVGEVAEPQEDSTEETGPSSSSSDSLAENLHALPLSQLLEQQKRLKEEKKTLRRSLREFDEEFLSKTGRRPQKQDRLIIETIYIGYKQSKAKLRLLEALIAKKSQVKRNSC